MKKLLTKFFIRASLFLFCSACLYYYSYAWVDWYDRLGSPKEGVEITEFHLTSSVGKGDFSFTSQADRDALLNLFNDAINNWTVPWNFSVGIKDRHSLDYSCTFSDWVTSRNGAEIYLDGDEMYLACYFSNGITDDYRFVVRLDGAISKKALDEIKKIFNDTVGYS